MNINEIFETVDKIYARKESHLAEEYLLSTLSQAESEPDYGAVIVVCNELGGFYRATGKYASGVPLYEKALNAIEKLGINNSENHAVTLINYATNYSVWGKSKQALMLFKQAYNIMQNICSGPDYRLATLHNNMSILCQDMKEYDEALSHLNAALSILKQLSESEIEIATTYTNMAQIYLYTGNLMTAKDLVIDALNLFVETSGDTDVHYSSAVETMGQILFMNEQYTEALSYFEKAQNLTARDYGTDSLPYKAVSESIKLCQQEIENETP